LHGAEAALRQVLVTRGVFFRELQGRLCACNLRLGRFDLRLLDGDLRIDAADAGFRGGDLRLGLFERDAVVALVDLAITPFATTCWLSVTGTAMR
jgi:hypothetical protein